MILEMLGSVLVKTNATEIPESMILHQLINQMKPYVV